MDVILEDIQKIVPYARNPRDNTRAVDKVAASIKEFGFRQPIVVNKENVIIAGHTRYLAAQKLGMDKVPIHTAEGLTKQQVKAYRLADNRVSQESSWDIDLLKLELPEIDGMFTGFSKEEIEQLMYEPDFAPASEGDQGALDTLEPKWVECPNCGREFNLRDVET